MLKRSSKLALLVSIMLIFQLVSSVVPAFAAGLAAPSKLQVTVSNTNDIYLKWDADYYSKSFLVYNLNGGQKELVGKATARNLNLLKAAEGSYEFAVSALSSTGEETALSPSVKVEIVYPEIKAPTGLTSITYSGNDVMLKWDSAANATKYNIYQVTDGQKQLIATTNNTSHYLSRLPEGDFHYEVTTVSDRFGESKTGSQITVSVVYPELQPPAGLTSNIYNGNDVSLTWEKAENATKYNVYRIFNNQKEFVTSTTDSQIFFSTVPEGDYIYEVTSVSDRFGESDAASQTNVSIVFPELQSPEDLTYKIENGNDVLLDWKDMDYANKYNIYRITDGQKEFVTSTTVSQYYFSQLPEGNYTYEVTTVNNRFGESEQGSQISVPLVYPKMQAPEGITYQVFYGNDLSIDWQDVEYANKYYIYQITDGEKKLVATVKDSQQYFSQLPEGDYEYEITAVSNRFGESAIGGQLNVSLVYPELQPPTGLKNQIVNGNDVILNWDKAEYANKYNVYRVEDGQRELVSSTTDLQSYLSMLPEGKYAYEVTTVSNRFGESKEASKVTFTIEFPNMEAPVVHLEMPEHDSAMITWEKVSYANSYAVYEFVDGEAQLLTKVTSTSYTASDLPDGKHEYAVVAISNRFGTSPFSNKVAAEVKPKLAAPPVDAPKVDGDDVTLTWDTVEGADSYNVYEEVDGEKVLVGNTTDPAITVEDLEAGDHEFIIVPVGESGVESSESTTVTVQTEESDITPPVTTSNAADKWESRAFHVVLTATDDKSGVAKTFYSINGSEFVEGTSFDVTESGVNKVSFYSIDNAGNKEEAQTVEVKLDEKAPETTSNVTGEWLNDSFLVKLTATDDFSGVEKNYYSINGSEYTSGSSFVVSEPGVNKVSFFSIDRAGNIEDEKTVEVKIDKTAPETVSNVTDKWHQGEVSVELTATDDLSGVAKTFYSINGADFKEGTAFTVGEEGVNKISFYSVDNAGNQEEAKTVEVKIDKTAPETVSDVVDQWNQKEAAVNLTATDNLSGAAHTYYAVNGSEFVEGTSFTVSEEGVNEVSFYSVDHAGNVEETKTVEIKIDKTAPETVSDVKDQWNKGEAAVQLSATDDLSGTAHTYYSINGSEFVEGTSFTVSEEGINKVSFYSVDNAGNKEEAKAVEVKIDKTAPVTVSEVTDQWSKGEAAVQLTATDDLSGTAHTYYSVNGSEFTEGTSFTVSEEGINQVSFYSVDHAGNVEETKTVEVKIDKTAPETVSDVTDKWNKGEAAVQLTATDDLSGTAHTYYSINGSDFIEGTSFTVSEEGINQVSFYSVDNAGNKEAAKTVEVKIDKTAPTVSGPTKMEVALGSAFTVDYTAKDNLSGIVAEEVTVNGKTYQKGDKIKLCQPGKYKLVVTVTDAAGWTTKVEKEIVVYIEADLDVLPRVIKGNKGVFTVKVDLPCKYLLRTFFVPSVTLNGVSAAPKNLGLLLQAEFGMFKFEREDFDWKKGEQELELRGYLDNGILVIARTTVDVK